MEANKQHLRILPYRSDRTSRMGSMADKVSAQISLEVHVNCLRTTYLPKNIFSTTIIFHLHSKKTSGIPSMLDYKLFPTLPEADPMMK